jgi:signal transduction histidine kinase
VVRDTGSLPDAVILGPPAAASHDPGPGPRWQAEVTEGWPGWIDLAWLILWGLGLAAIVIFEHWEEIPFDLIWISFAVAYSVRVRDTRPTLWLLAAMAVTTFGAIGVDVLRHTQPCDELTAVPLMAAMFWVLMWHGRRRSAANAERIRVSEDNARLLAAQQQFLQDASHQLRTPITIALGHSELLARNLADHQDQRDIRVIVGELNRLRKLSERLLLIAASADPGFLQAEPVELDQFVADVLCRWQPAADRHWQLGPLDDAIVPADAERLGLAVDALLENAIQHTDPEDMIRLSVLRADDSGTARLIVQDTGSGIEPDEMRRIFDRFASGPHAAGRRGTGLGLPLVRAVTEGHGGQVSAQSSPGLGSRFELHLPMRPGPDGGERPAGPAAHADTDACGRPVITPVASGRKRG